MVVLPAVNSKPKDDLNLWTASLGDLDWTYIERPTQREMDVLSKKYTFLHPLNLEDCLSRIQRPKVDEYDEHLFMVLHFPVFDKEINAAFGITKNFSDSQVIILILHQFKEF